MGQNGAEWGWMGMDFVWGMNRQTDGQTDRNDGLGYLQLYRGK